MYAFVQDEAHAWQNTLVTQSLHEAKKLARVQMVRHNKFPGFVREVLVASYQITFVRNSGAINVFMLLKSEPFDLSRTKHFVEISEKEMAEIVERQMVEE